ncbi:ARMC7.2 family protein [Megaselia abdita]
MFSSQKQLKKRTPANGINREEYISQLAKEFIETNNIESKEQVLANLANFSYDPINYAYLKKSSVLNIFLETLKNPDKSLVLHATAGISNLCNCLEFQPFILQPDSQKDLKALLNTPDNSCDIKVNVVTILYLIISQNNHTKDLICTPDLVRAIRKLRSSSCINLRNIATLFITDFATRVETRWS